MKKTVTTFVFVFAATLNGFVNSALAVDQNALCSNFTKAVCENDGTYLRQAELFATFMRQHAFSTMKQFGPLDSIVKELEQPMGGGRSLDDVDAKRYIGLIEEKAILLSGLDREKIRQDAANILQTLRISVRENTSLDETTKLAMLDNLSKIAILFPTEYMDKYPSTSKEWLFKGCGPYALKPWGFGLDMYDTYDKTHDNMMVLCPTMISIWNSQSGHVQFVLGHEYGHFIDESKFGKAYDKMRACAKPYENNQSFFRYDGPSNGCMGEISADFWGSEVVTRMSVRNPGVIKNAMVHFCGWAPGRVHPGGDFRISQFGNHPMVRALLGCTGAPAAGSPSCNAL